MNPRSGDSNSGAAERKLRSRIGKLSYESNSKVAQPLRHPRAHDNQRYQSSGSQKPSSVSQRKTPLRQDLSPYFRRKTDDDLDSDVSIPTSKSARRPGSKASRKRRDVTPPDSELPPLPDALQNDLIVVLCGLNPGLATSQTGHAYNHPSNLFYKLLHSSGCTPYRCKPEEDRSFPERFGLGLTNIVARASRDGSRLTAQEKIAGVSILEKKIAKCRPEAVALVGKGIWESVCQAKGWSSKLWKGSDFKYGWQDEAHLRLGKVGDWPGAKLFVATSTSGLAAGLRPKEKEEIWAPLGQYIRRRRTERGQWIQDL